MSIDGWHTPCYMWGNMKIQTDFNNGFKIIMPNGAMRRFGSCTWHDDPYAMIEGTTLKMFSGPRETEPEHTEILPSGTIVRRWDEENDDPIIHVVA